MPKLLRCSWADTNEIFYDYHDHEWGGAPVHDERKLFEMLSLEGAQAGLSWLTILKRRDNYRQAFDNFDLQIVARYDEAKRMELMIDVGIIRNRLKIGAVVKNAQAILAIQDDGSSFDRFIWEFTDGKQLQLADHEQAIAISKQMSRALKQRGFTFVGPTICHSFMQAIGMVNDHEAPCFLAIA